MLEFAEMGPFFETLLYSHAGKRGAIRLADVGLGVVASVGRLNFARSVKLQGIGIGCVFARRRGDGLAVLKYEK